MASLEELLATRRVIVCCGSGGVGKTTISAALGLAAALRGRRVLVCTIDPAKRLAASLGLAELGNDEREIGKDLLSAGGAALPPGGSLHAMMLDQKRTFDRLIERYAPTPEHAKRILENHIYRRFSGQLAGSQEYMAMEKLHELHESGRYDLVILDTPPNKHALDFLSAPKRLAEFLDGSILQWFLAPYWSAGRWSMGIVQAIAKKVIDWLDGIFGLETLKELSEFFRAFEALWGGFQERALRVTALLSDAGRTAFIVVTSPTGETVDEARYFTDKLRESGMPLAGIIANRVHVDHMGGAGGVAIEAGPLAEAARSEDALEFLLARLGEEWKGDAVVLAAVRKAVVNFQEHCSLARADRARLLPLEEMARAAGVFSCELPALDRDVHDIEGLVGLERILCVAAPAR